MPYWASSFNAVRSLYGVSGPPAPRPGIAGDPLGLRLGVFLLGLGGLHDDRAAQLLDRRDRRLGGARHFDGQLGLQFALAEQPDTVAHAAQEAGGHQVRPGHRLAGVQALVLDRLLQAAQVHFRQLEAEDVVEALLGQAAEQRHLAAFEPLDGDAGTRGLALAAAAAGLALARTDAAADADAALAGARIVGKLIEFHDLILLSPRPMGLSRAWSAFLLRRFDPHEMADLADHAAHRRRVGDFAAAVHLVEAEADQRVALTGLAADRAADLGDLQFAGHVRLVLLARVGFSAA